MTLRDLTESQVEDFRRAAEAFLAERRKSRPDINPIDYKLYFSDGLKAVLSRIEELPK